MIDINLLPLKLRKRARKKLDVNFSLVIGAVLIAFFFIYIIVEAQAKYERAKIEGFTSKLETLDKQFREAKASLNEIRPLNQRLKTLGKLRESRILWAKILNHLSDVFPEGLQLKLLQDEGDVLVLKGDVGPKEGDESVIRLIEELKDEEKTSFSAYFSQIVLESITKEKQGNVKRFRIRCRFSKELRDGA